MSTTNTAPTFDKIDAAYIIEGLQRLYTEAARSDRKDVEALRDFNEGELNVYGKVWDVTVHAAEAISDVIDFDSGELGVFAYEHLDDTTPGSLVHTLFERCVMNDDKVQAVVEGVAIVKGWPRK